MRITRTSRKSVQQALDTVKKMLQVNIRNYMNCEVNDEDYYLEKINSILLRIKQYEEILKNGEGEYADFVGNEEYIILK